MSYHSNVNGINFDLTRLIKVKYDGVLGLPIHDFLFWINSNALPNAVNLHTTRLRNLIDPDFDLQGYSM